MQVDNLMTPDLSKDYYDPSFRDTLESHVTYFRGLSTTTQVQLKPNDTVIYNQDLFGYLNSINIAPCYQWMTMRVNNMFSPYDFNDSFTFRPHVISLICGTG